MIASRPLNWLPAFAAGLLITAVSFSPVRAVAQDRISTTTGIQDGRIVSVKGANIMFELPGGKGTIGIPLATVRRVEKDAPPEYAKAVQQYEQGNYDAALGSLQTIVSTYGGLPVDWAMTASSMLGDTQVSLGRLADAEKSYASFKSKYPGASGSERAEIGMARIEVEKKEFESARKRLAPYVDRALQKVAPDAAASGFYGQVFLLMGRIEQAAGNDPAALENYLRTVTIFREDGAALSEATKAAGELSKKTVVP